MQITIFSEPKAVHPSPLDRFEWAAVSIAIRESDLKAGEGFHSLMRKLGGRLFGTRLWKKRQGFANEQLEQLRRYVCLMREGQVAAQALRAQLVETGFSVSKLSYIDQWAVNSR